MHQSFKTHLRHISNGNERAFRRLVHLYYDRLYQFAFSIVKNREDVEEIIHDVFLKIWRLRENLPESDKFTAYLYRAVKNTSLNYLKKNNKKEEVERIYKLNPELKSLRTPEDLVISEETLSCIKEAINALPLRCRKIFTLVKEDGLSYRQAAELLDISPATVNVQMTIALKKLWKTLDHNYKNTHS